MSREDRIPKPHRTNGTLFDIGRFCQRLLSTANKTTYEEFVLDYMIQSVIVLHLIHVGEASKKLSASFREDHPEIDWAAVIGLRNILVHRYYDIDYKTVWDIVINNIPRLLDVVSSHLERFGEPDSEAKE